MVAPDTQRQSSRSSGNPASLDRYCKNVCLSGLASLSGKKLFVVVVFLKKKKIYAGVVERKWKSAKSGLF